MVVRMKEMFQSHFGLILTFSLLLHFSRVNSFQSHFGLILTCLTLWKMYSRVLVSIPFWSDFNGGGEEPLAEFSCVSIPFWSDFNWEVVLDNFGVEGFQSHFGLILTPFNPLDPLFVQTFQSHFGLILTYAKPKGFPHISLFQSHFGLILTPPLHPNCRCTISVSIPFWSDFNLAEELIIITDIIVSIPFWSDFNLKKGGSRSGRVRVSIPFWSDFNPRGKPTGRGTGLRFNPILVWF